MGVPTVTVLAVIVSGSTLKLGAPFLGSVVGVAVPFVLIMAVYHAILAALLPARWPTVADRIRSGWPVEVLILGVAAVIERLL